VKNLKIGSRILLGFSAIVFLLLLVAGASVFGNLQTFANIEGVNNFNELQAASNKVMDIYNETRMSARMLYQDRADTSFSDYAKQVLYVDNRLQVLRGMVQGNAELSEFASALQQFDTLFQAWRGNVERLQAAYQAGATTLAQADLIIETRNLDMQAREAIGNLNLDIAYRATQGLTDTLSTGQLDIIITIICSALALVLAIILMVLIVPSITRPLSRIQEVLARLGHQGDFHLPEDMVAGISIDAAGKDEVATCAAAALMLQQNLSSLSRAIDTVADGDLTVQITPLSDKDSASFALISMLDNLNHKFSTIRLSAQEVHSAAEQLDSGFQNLVACSDQQAAEVEMLSSYIENVASQTKTNTDMAGKTTALAETIQKSAQTGSSNMNEMVKSVTEINEASKSIADIIKIIDDIAFQTNILALNAAVEAARAGQHGKGFAVVADEVRSLAAKSAEAAHNTGNLIDNTIKKAKMGVEIAQKTSSSLAEIVEGIRQSSEIMNGIANSFVSQAETVKQISEGIERVTVVAGQTSSTARDSAASTSDITGQAAILEELVAQFQLKV
jgi:methyl-accepting chemotaxis protein